MPAKTEPKIPFVHFIAEHRLARGLTQKKLEELLGAKAMTVSRWEQYKVRVDMPILAAIAEALDPTGALEAEDLLHHPERPTANQLLRRVPKDDREAFIRQIKRAAGD